MLANHSNCICWLFLLLEFVSIVTRSHLDVRGGGVWGRDEVCTGILDYILMVFFLNYRCQLSSMAITALTCMHAI